MISRCLDAPCPMATFDPTELARFREQLNDWTGSPPRGMAGALDLARHGRDGRKFLAACCSTDGSLGPRPIGRKCSDSAAGAMLTNAAVLLPAARLRGARLSRLWCVRFSGGFPSSAPSKSPARNYSIISSRGTRSSLRTFGGALGADA